MRDWIERHNTPGARIDALVVLAVVGTIMFYAIDLTERACLPWHVSRRRA